MTTRRALTLSGTVLFATAATAVANVGTGISSSPIVLRKHAVQGHTYRLPSVLVVNTGTERTRYRLHVQRLPGRMSGRRFPASWIRFAHRSIVLNAGRSAQVQMTLRVPRRAAAARYSSDIIAASVPPRGAATGASAAAATIVRFTVVRGRKHHGR